MKKRILSLIMSLFMIVSTVPLRVSANEMTSTDYGIPGVDYAQGEAIVYVEGGPMTLNPPMSRSRNASAYELEELMTVEPIAQPAIKSPSILRNNAFKATKSLVLVKSQQDTESLISDLQSLPTVEFAEPNYYIKPYGIDVPDPDTNPGYTYQWALKNQLNNNDPAIPSADVKAETAWSTIDLDPSSEVPVVAVLDSGVDYNHPDLQNIMWSKGENYETLKAMGGGAYGYNALYPLFSNERKGDPMDTDIGHGTHCAGIIGAQWNNAEGVVGVSPNVQIMAVRFLSASGGDVAASLRGYAYIQAAAEAGVNVVAINNSWGPGIHTARQLRSVSTAATAIGEQHGVVSCFAAGNDNVSNDHNTGAIVNSPYIITVGAMDSQGYKSGFSCYGQETVDVFAPGSQILSATSKDTTAFPMNEHTMPAQYLPQLQPAEDSYFYEDFEDGSSEIELRLLNTEGAVVAVSDASNPCRGYASDHALQLSLDQIKDGDPFTIEIRLHRDILKNTDLSKTFYLAFQGGFDNALYGQNFIIQYQDEQGQWQTLNSTQVTAKDPNGTPIEYLPTRLRTYDHNWNQSSQEILLPDFGKYVDPDAKDTITLRLINLTDDGKPAPMNGKDDSQPSVFRLDDFGFGKKASDYYYSDGTSMATPMVTGIAALLSTQYDTPEEICARIKGGVNRKAQADLENASISMGYIDATAALNDEQCVPVLNDLSIEGNTAILKGYFFGSQGRLTLGHEEVPVLEWTSEKIRFTLPIGIEGKQEITVSPTGKNDGRGFFIITPDTKDYTVLTAPDIKLSEIEGYTLRSADLQPLTMAATDQKIAYLGFLEEDYSIYMSIYDIESDQWQKDPVPLPEDFSSPANLTAGKTKFYLTYSSLNPDPKTPEANTLRLGTYDPATSTWTCVDPELNGNETIVVYEDKLLAVGGEEIIENDNGQVTSRALKTVRIIDPETGKIVGNLPDMPDGRSGLLTGITVSASGKTLMVHGGHNGFLNPDLKIYTNTLSFDGEQWTRYDDHFPNEENLDPSQTVTTAFAALNNNQMIAVGPVKDLGTKDMLDTWYFTPEDSQWTGAPNKLYSQTKTTQTIGVASGDQFYVLGYTGRHEDSLIFRSTTVDYTGPTGDPSSEAPTPPEPTPSIKPSPTVIPTDQNTTGTDSNAKTGILNPHSGLTLSIVALLLLASIGGVVFLDKKNR